MIVVKEALVECLNCGAYETLYFTNNELDKTQGFIEKDGAVWHYCEGYGQWGECILL